MGPKKRRVGASEVFSVSTDAETKVALKALADERHGGNVSELITALAHDAIRNSAADRLWSWAGVPEMTTTERRAFWAEVEAGWKTARRSPKRAKKRAA